MEFVLDSVRLSHNSYVIIFFRVCLEDSSCFCFCRLFLISFSSRCLTRICSCNLGCRLSDVPRAPSVDFRSSSWRSILKQKNESMAMHLISKWLPIRYSFVCVLISPLCLIFTSKLFCILIIMAR